MFPLNTVRNLSHYLRASDKSVKPQIITLIATNKCNLNCVMCNYRNKEKMDELSFDEIDSLLKEDGSKIHLIGGEFFLRKDAMDLIKLIKDKGLELRITTNATIINNEIANVLTSKKVDEIVISIDGIKKTHNKIRGSKNAFQNAIQGIKNMQAEKNKQKSNFPKIGINTMVSKINYKEIPELASSLTALNIDNITLNYLFDINETDIQAAEKILGATDREVRWYSTESNFSLNLNELNFIINSVKNNKLISLDPFIKNYKKNGRKIHKSCLYLYIATWITPEGDVLPCPMIENYVAGNIKEDSLENIFNNEKYRNIRKNCHKLPICSKCCMMKRTLKEHLGLF